MEKFDKILELLDKKSLTKDDQKVLKQYADSDEEIKSFVNIYKKLSSSLNASGHLPTDLLAFYVLNEKEDDFENKIIAILSGKIKSHLTECPICSDEYKMLLNEFSDISEHLDKVIHPETPSKVEDKAILPLTIFRRSNSFRYAFATLAVFVIAYFGLFIVSTSITPDYKKNIFANEQEDFYKTRGRTSPLFQQGLNAIDNGEYSTAIQFLNVDIEEHKNEKSIFYTHYIIGITYLKSAESDFIGLFKSYDRDQVNLAIANLKESIDKNKSGDYESLKLDAYYYMGRAYLLNDERDSAIPNFQKVIDGKGKYSREAAQLIVNLEKN